MSIEYEVRILNIPVDATIELLERFGAIKVGCFHQKRYVYDYNPIQKGKWIRLRSNGIFNTLTLKEIKSLRIDGTSELEITVSDFDETNKILNKLGYSPRTFQENYRIEYRLGETTFDIDKWPKIPVYMEIEGTSEQAVVNALAMLGFNEHDFTTKDVDTIYREIYGIQLNDIKYLEFSSEELSGLKKYHDDKENNNG